MAGFFYFKKKNSIFINSTNFFGKLKETYIRKEKGNTKSELLYANQQKLFAHLQQTVPQIKIIRGHIQNYNGIYKEKGVDVRLALDLYSLAIENKYDKAILISSDSDLVPAVRMVQI